MYLKVPISNPYVPDFTFNKPWLNVLKAFGRTMKIALLALKFIYHEVASFFFLFFGFFSMILIPTFTKAIISLRFIRISVYVLMKKLVKIFSRVSCLINLRLHNVKKLIK